MSLLNGWTGGQYSLYRLLLGAYLCVHLASLVSWGPELFSSAGMLADRTLSPLHPVFPSLFFAFDAHGVVQGALLLGVLASLLLAVGLADRVAAVVLWYLWASLFARNPLISNPSLPFVGWLLLAHALLPRAPYGSWSARGRVDPGAGWQMPPAIFAAAWIVMSLAYSYSGYTKLVSPSWVDGSALARVLENPLARPTALRDLILALPAPLLSVANWGAVGLELCFAPLALVRRLRPWLWLAMVGMHASLILVIDFADLSLAMLLVHAFTFDPAWVRAREAAGNEPLVLYYDGACGLCHRTVRFLLAEDRAGALRFAPLDSESFRRAVPDDERRALPDSLVLRTEDGTLRVRSDAVLEAALALGGFWRVAAGMLRQLPASPRDRIYDLVAGVRHRLFAPPTDACPLVPDSLRQRFLS